MQKILLSLVLMLFGLNIQAKDRPILTFYCGTTMAKPIAKIAKIIEAKHNCKIRIVQGTSKDLYDILKDTQRGDLYLPGSNAYRLNNLKDGFLKEAQYVGYNQAAIFVQKSNPKNLKSLDDFLDENIATMLGNPEHGSIGVETRIILTDYKGKAFFESVYDNSIRIGIDSRDLSNTLSRKELDAVINWKAVSLWSENNNSVDIIEIDEIFASKKLLYINLLKFSKYPEIAKDFMHYASSIDGRKIMRRYGFLD